MKGESPNKKEREERYMVTVEYRMEDVFRYYGGEPPKSVLRYCALVDSGGVWCHMVNDKDVFKDKESGKAYFKAVSYAYPFADKCDFRKMLKSDLKFSLYNGRTSGFAQPVRCLLCIVKHLNKGSISFRMGYSGEEYVRKALMDMIHLAFCLRNHSEDCCLTIFTLEGLRQVLTELRIDKAVEPPMLPKSSSEEAFEIVEYCRCVLLGMLGKGQEVLPLPENLEN